MLGVILLLQALTLAVSGPSTSPEYLPLRVAEAEGYFAREGLAVTLKTTRAEPGAAEALAQGQADLAATSLEAILRFGPRTASQSPRLVLGLTAAPPVVLVVADAHRTIVRSLDDLPGTRVGVSTPGAPEQAWFAWLLARAGLSVAQMWMVSRGERGVVHAVETGDVHAALVHEPAASRLIASGQARALVDLRSPEAVRQAVGAPTVNAAVFMRSDRRPRERDLTAFARAVLAAQRRMADGDGNGLASKLPRAVTVGPDAFEARLAACRELYLKDGLVTVEQVRETLILIRAHLPLPVTARVPRPEDLVHVEAARRAVSPSPAR
jgi:NitT/TauT family transport system substrate-binding protein